MTDVPTRVYDPVHPSRGALATVLFPLVQAMPAAAQDPAPRVEDVTELQGLSARWTAALETLEVPGFAVAVVKDGAVLALDAFGVRNAAGEPATPDSCYYIASATKPFTAMAVCMLAGEGKLELDASLKDVLPEFVLPSEDLTVALTLRDLLCHRHGLECGPIVHRDAYTGQITDEIYFRLLQDAKIANYVRYSNIHFTLAGRAIEAASGLKWQDFLDQRLFEPAGMMRTTAYASEMYGKFEHAEPMLRIEGKWRRSPLVKTDRTMHAAGGMGTTARDAARWLILNLNGGEIDGRRILPETMEEEYYSKNSDLPVPQGSIWMEEGFALGWCVGKYREPTRPYFFHGGGYVGAASYICFLPEHGIGVAALANSDGGAAMATIVTIDVLDRLLGVTGQPDLLPNYEESTRQRRAQAPSVPAGGVNPARAPDGLSRPPETYAGTYSDPILGELEIFLDARGGLAARAGDLSYVLVSEGTDEFTAIVVPGMVERGRFQVSSDGTVEAVSFADGESATRFGRTGTKSR